MNSLSKIITLLSTAFVLALSFSSCQEVIVLDLEDAPTRLILEANLNATDGTCAVYASNSNGFYDTSDIITVNNLNIELEADDGTTYSFSEFSNGQYLAEGISTTAGQVFSIRITDVDGINYNASTYTPAATSLDSLSVEDFEFPFLQDIEAGYQVSANWQDPANQDDFYRLKYTHNGDYDPGNYNFSSDEVGDGDTQTIGIRDIFSAEDTLKVELLVIDENTYNYFAQVSEIQGAGFSGTSPYNPKGNFDNEALGYFGIYHTSEISVILE